MESRREGENIQIQREEPKVFNPPVIPPMFNNAYAIPLNTIMPSNGMNLFGLFPIDTSNKQVNYFGRTGELVYDFQNGDQQPGYYQPNFMNNSLQNCLQNMPVVNPPIPQPFIFPAYVIDTSILRSALNETLAFPGDNQTKNEKRIFENLMQMDSQYALEKDNLNQSNLIFQKEKIIKNKNIKNANLEIIDSNQSTPVKVNQGSPDPEKPQEKPLDAANLNYDNLPKMYRLNVKNVILFYNNDLIKFSNQQYISYFQDHYAPDALAISQEEYKDVSYVKVLIHFSKLKILNGKTDFHIKLENTSLIAPEKLMLFDKNKYNMASFIGDEKISDAEFYSFRGKKVCNIAKSDFLEKIRSKRCGNVFIDGKEIINIGLILQETYTVIKKKYKKK